MPVSSSPLFDDELGPFLDNTLGTNEILCLPPNEELNKAQLLTNNYN